MRVAIIGAGLGGLAAAIALQDQGIDVQIYERARALRPIGAGLTIAPNGLAALQAIDPAIVPALLQQGTCNRQVNLRKANGDLVTKIPITFTDTYGQPVLNILWSSLQQTLIGFLPAESIHLNHQLVDFEYANEALTLRFNGRGPVTADLLIGADGINSAVRQTMIHDGPPRYAGRLSWRSVIRHRHPWLLPDEVTFFAGTDGKNFAVFDVGKGLTFWSATALRPDVPAVDTAAAAKQRVVETFTGWAPLVEQMLQATPPEVIVERPVEDRAPLTRWSNGPVTLLGDAAHAMVPALGQGANTAFEDAWELAQSLTCQPDIQAALAQYENSRMPRTHVIHARSADQGSRFYAADNETFSRYTLEKANAGQRDFEDWLYGYTPPPA